ncbi:hypothetical protein QL285_059070 [Trifolium repens]|nr:hypothetical protein QL285_059070 [Trifolium repens]
MAATFGGDCVLCEMNFGRTSRIGSGIMMEFWHDKWWYHLSPLFFMPQLQPLQMQNGSNNIMVQWTMPEDGTIALNTNDVDEKYKHVIQQEIRSLILPLGTTRHLLTI